VRPAEGDRLRQVLERGTGAGGVLRVVQPQERRAGEHVRRDGPQVGQPAPRARQWQRVRGSAGEYRAGPVHGVARIGSQHDVPGVHKGQGHVHQALFRAQQRQHLALRIDRHAEAPPIVGGDGATQRRRAKVARVGVRVAPLRRGDQRIHDRARRGQVRPPDAQVDDVDAAATGLGDAPFDPGEHVWGQVGDALRYLHGSLLDTCGAGGVSAKGSPSSRVCRTSPTRCRLSALTLSTVS